MLILYTLHFILTRFTQSKEPTRNGFFHSCLLLHVQQFSNVKLCFPTLRSLYISIAFLFDIIYNIGVFRRWSGLSLQLELLQNFLLIAYWSAENSINISAVLNFFACIKLKSGFGLGNRNRVIDEVICCLSHLN